MMKPTSRNGQPIDEDTGEVKPQKTKRLSLKDKNIIQTYYWYYDLQGRLKRDVRPPGYWHGRPRPFIREDIEESEDDWEGNLLTSYLRYYSDKDTLKAQMVTKYKKFEQTFLGEEVAENALVRKNVLFMLTEIPPEPDKHGHIKGKGRFGWELYAEDGMEFRRKKSTKSKPKPKRSPPKKIKKVVRKKVIKKRK